MRPQPLLVLILLAALCTGCRRGEFHLSGTVTTGAGLQHKIPMENSVLFVIVKNRGGVPVAVRRIVNPQFPAAFEVGQRDLLVPELRGGQALRVQAQMNTHGNLGSSVRGDLEGEHPDDVYPGESKIHVVLDRQVELPLMRRLDHPR